MVISLIQTKNMKDDFFNFYFQIITYFQNCWFTFLYVFIIQTKIFKKLNRREFQSIFLNRWMNMLCRYIENVYIKKTNTFISSQFLFLLTSNFGLAIPAERHRFGIGCKLSC